MQKQEYFRIEKMEKIHFWYRGMRSTILNFLSQSIKPPAKILDAGCGAGGRAVDCMKYGFVAAIDINETAIKLTMKKNISQVIQASICKLPFQKDTFDAVLCLDVLYHRGVPDDQLALRECYRVLKPGGVFILRLPAFEFLRGSHDIVVYTKKRYTSKEVKKMVADTGFQELRVTYANMILSIPLAVRRIFERLVTKKHKPHSDSSALPGFLNAIFFHILLFEKKLLQFLNFPFGSSVICICRKPHRNCDPTG